MLKYAIHTVQMLMSALTEITDAAGMKLYSKKATPFHNFICLRNLFEVRSRKDESFSPTFQLNAVTNFLFRQREKRGSI